MPRRYADLNDLISELDETDSLNDDPYGLAFDDEDIALLGAMSPDQPRRPPQPAPAPKKRGRPKKKT
jgi:hypothetical protein